MNDVAIAGKVYSMLFITDYEEANPKWRLFVDTIINNLLDKPAEYGGGWRKFNLPPITVSIINKAETADQAFTRLREDKYDVVFVNNVLENKPVGGGKMKQFRKLHPDAIFIPFLSLNQKKGAPRGDGTVSSGEGLLNLYNSGFYNGIFKNNMNLAYTIEMIHAGGRTAESAFSYYGLEFALEQRGDVTGIKTENPVMEEKAVPEKVYEKTDVIHSNFPDEEKKEEIRPEEPKINSSYVETVADSVKEPEIAQKDFEMDSQKQHFERRKDKKKKGIGQSRSSYPENGGEERAAVKQDVFIEERRTESTQPDYSQLAEGDGMTSTNNEMYSDASQMMYPEFNAQYGPEIREMMRQRSQMNSGLVTTGTLYGNVMFADGGTTVIIKLDKSLEQVGLKFTDILNVPVTIPYVKFGKVD